MTEEDKVRSAYYARPIFNLVIIGTPRDHKKAKEFVWEAMKNKNLTHQVKTHVAKNSVKMPADHFFDVENWQAEIGQANALIAFTGQPANSDKLMYYFLCSGGVTINDWLRLKANEADFAIWKNNNATKDKMSAEGNLIENFADNNVPIKRSNV